MRRAFQFIKRTVGWSIALIAILIAFAFGPAVGMLTILALSAAKWYEHGFDGLTRLRPIGTYLATCPTSLKAMLFLYLWGFGGVGSFILVPIAVSPLLVSWKRLPAP